MHLRCTGSLQTMRNAAQESVGRGGRLLVGFERSRIKGCHLLYWLRSRGAGETRAGTGIRECLMSQCQIDRRIEPAVPVANRSALGR